MQKERCNTYNHTLGVIDPFSRRISFTSHRSKSRENIRMIMEWRIGDGSRSRGCLYFPIPMSIRITIPGRPSASSTPCTTKVRCHCRLRGKLLTRSCSWTIVLDRRRGTTTVVVVVVEARSRVDTVEQRVVVRCGRVFPLHWHTTKKCGERTWKKEQLAREFTRASGKILEAGTSSVLTRS